MKALCLQKCQVLLLVKLIIGYYAKLKREVFTRPQIIIWIKSQTKRMDR